MRRVSREKAIDEIRSGVDIVEVVGEFVKLKRSGTNYSGLCPFHSEKTPSFSVSQSKQIFKCFGCGEGGDVFSFLQKYNAWDFPTTLEWLAKKAGIEIDAGDFRKFQNTKKYYEINRHAGNYFYKNMRKYSNPGYKYMLERGLSEDILNRFAIGYASDGEELYAQLHDKGFSDDDMLKLGIMSQKDGRIYCPYSGRVIFPILDVRSRLIGFGARAIRDSRAKYINSRESVIFRKRENLYAIDKAAKEMTRTDYAILAEGYMDVISLHRYGFTNAVASLGTALTPGQAAIIKRYAGRVYISYDGDAAGINAALRAGSVLKEAKLNVKVIRLEAGKDPDEILKEKGTAGFEKAISNAQNFEMFFIADIAKPLNLNLAEDKEMFIKKTAQFLATLVPAERYVYSEEVAKLYNIPEEVLTEQIEIGSNGAADEGAAVRNNQGREDIKKIDVLSNEDCDITESEKMLVRLTFNESIFLEKLNNIGIDIYIKSRVGKNLIKAVEEAYDSMNYANISVKDVTSRLDEVFEVEVFESISAHMLMNSDYDTIFKETLRNIEIEELDKQIKQTKDELNLGEDVLNEEQRKKLQKKLERLIGVKQDKEGA